MIHFCILLQYSELGSSYFKQIYFQLQNLTGKDFVLSLLPSLFFKASLHWLTSHSPPINMNTKSLTHYPFPCQRLNDTSFHCKRNEGYAFSELLKLVIEIKLYDTAVFHTWTQSIGFVWLLTEIRRANVNALAKAKARNGLLNGLSQMIAWKGHLLKVICQGTSANVLLHICQTELQIQHHTFLQHLIPLHLHGFQ